jgi:hypothetical protein
VTSLHQALGYLLIGVNALAGLIGGWAWWQDRHTRAFWPLLRAGQVLVALQAAGGVALLIDGRSLPRLHLIYGLTPLAVAFVAEQLRLASADTILQQRGLEGSADVAKLEPAEQRALVSLIVRRETGVMAASAIVVALLAGRAQGWVL